MSTPKLSKAVFLLSGGVTTVACGQGDPIFGSADGNLYTDATPVCHYLERGINDQSNRTDTYILTPPAIEKLADMDQITFGLDLPITRCQDNPRSLPCSDKDHPTEWCISRVSLALGEVILYDDSAPAGGCLLAVRSGLGGMRKISSAALRLNNPNWGLTEAEVEAFFDQVVFSSGDFDFQPNGYRIPATTLEAVIEQAIGSEAARDRKGAANETFHGDRQGWVAGLAPAADADCDLGNCPSTSARRSSPWVEVRRSGPDRITVDVDVDFSLGTPDISDCIKTDLAAVPNACGTFYTQFGHGSVRTEFRLGCEEKAEVTRNDTGDQLTMPYCGEGGIEERCFDLTIGPVSSVNGTIRCPAGTASSSCGKAARLVRSAFDQVIEATGEPELELEGGLLPSVLPFMCSFVTGLEFIDACKGIVIDKVEQRGRKRLASRVDDSLLPLDELKGLEGCPAFSISERGDIAFDLRELENCPDGARNPECFSGGGVLEPNAGDDDGVPPEGGIGGPGDLASGAGGAGEDSGEGAGRYAGQDEPTGPRTMPIGKIFDYLGLDARRDARAAARAAAEGMFGRFGREPEVVEAVESSIISGLGLASAPANGKIPMRRLDEALYGLCAMRKSCAADFDPAPLPLTDVIAVDFDALRVNLAMGNFAAVRTQIGSLLVNDEFRRNCVGHRFPNSIEPPGAPRPTDTQILNDFDYLSATADWFETYFDPAFSDQGAGSCRRTTATMENRIPASAVALTIETRGGNVADGFAFVNFQRNADVSTAHRRDYGCRNLRDFALEPSHAPVCGPDGFIEVGPHDRRECGTVAGQACADISAPYYGELWLTHADPEDRVFHPNGDFSWRNRCDFDFQTGEQLVCVQDFFPGAGLNRAPVCKRIGAPPPGEDPDLYTSVGLEVGPLDTCPVGYLKDSAGRCWDALRGQPDWECEADCEALYNGLGWCYHGQPWRMLVENLDPVFNAFPFTQAPFTYDKPICAEHVSCGTSGVRCAAQGMACDPATGQCVAECNAGAAGAGSAQCAASDPPPAYPDGFACVPGTNTCRQTVEAKFGGLP